MNKRNLAVMASCMLLYTSFAYAANVEETQNSDGVAAEKVNREETKLDEVVVTDTMLNPLKIPVKMTVITAEQIKAKGAQTVAEALKDVAGLNVTQLVKGKGAGQIRGSDANSTKVIVDGVMIGGGGDSRADLSIIPTDNIEKIEIFKGPVPVIYGSNAPGGVIFITTKDASGKAAGAFTLARGSWNAEMYALSVSGKADQLSYYLAGKKSKTGGYDDNPDNIGGYPSHTAEKSEYFNGKLKWDINPKSSLTVFGSYSETEKELPNRYGTTILNPTIPRMIPYPGSGGTLTARNNYYGGGNAGAINGLTYNWEYEPVRESYIGVVYNLKMNERNDISLKYYRSTLDSLLTADNVSNNLPAYQYVDWSGSVNGWELQHTMKTSKSNVVTWGYSWETRDFTELTPNQSSPVINRGDYDYTGQSFYIQDVANINSRLSTSFGYRHNSIDDGIVVDTLAFTPYHQDLRGKYTSDDPVFTLAYKLSDNTAIHGSIGTSFRSPTAMERSAPLNGPVLPEEGINREIGLTATAKGGIYFDFTYFSRDITNMIKGGGAGGGHSQYWNIPDVDMHGYELEVSKKINKRLKGFWNYSYTNAYDTTVHQQVSDVPFRKYSWGLNYADEGLVANLAVNYVGGRRSMFSQGNGNGNSDGNSSVTEVYNYWGTRDLAGYHVVDLKVSKNIENQEYYVKVLNLFDKDYYTGAYFVSPGRYVEVGTTIKF